MSRTPRVWAVIAPLLGVVACANVWGFDDLTAAPDGGTSDATTPGDGQSVAESGGGGDAAVEGAVAVTDSGGDAADARVDGEAGRDGAIADTGARDTGDEGAAAACRAICTGCCDSNGQCQAGNATAVCGNGGNACEVCPTSACTLSTPCCGVTSKQCGCATAGLLCNQN